MEKEFAMVDACNGTIMMERSCACRALKVEGQELYAMMHDSDGGDRWQCAAWKRWDRKVAQGEGEKMREEEEGEKMGEEEEGGVK